MNKKEQEEFDKRMEELKAEYIKNKRSRKSKPAGMKYFKNVKIIPGVCDKVLFTKMWVLGKICKWAC